MVLRLVVAALVPLMLAAPAGAGSNVVILSTTTSTQDSGLLDVLVPLFERRTGYTLKTISVGTGQALALAARGEADVVLCHAPSLEKRSLADGTLTNRRLVMYNDFVLVGPEAGPARIAGAKSVVAAAGRIAAAGGRAFADFIVSPEVQQVIRTFGVDRYGQPLFVPIAGQREEEVAP